MRKLLASAIGVLLVSALIAAGLESGPGVTASARQGAGSGATPAPVLSTGLPDEGVVSAATPPVAAGDPAARRASAPGTVTRASAKRTFPVASPAMYNVDRPAPRVDERLGAQLAAAAPTDRLVVLVHAADATSARRAAEANGLVVVTSFAKVGVVAAVGIPESIRALSTATGISYLEGDQPLSYFQDTSHEATRGEEARKGFSVSYEEPQPDIPGTSTQECTTKKNRRGRVVRDRRGRPVKTCRTVTTPPQPQPPITRTLTSPGVDGTGVSVAIIDSGVDGSHPMFQQDGKSKVVKNLKFVGFAQCLMSATCGGSFGNADDGLFVPVTDSDSISLGGHGTHVAGIAAGVDVTTVDGKKAHGAAPGAKLVSFSVGTGINIIGANAALNWVLEHHKDPCGKGACPPIKVTNNSYGPTGGGEFNPESATAKLQRALATEGVVTVWANGNGDAQNVGGDGSDNRSNPAGQDPTPGILSVANYNDGGAANRDNVLNSSSSRGNKGRPLTYPDLSAPGSDILSACRPQLAICRGTTTTDMNYGVIGGTSMAAPHIAGIVAQLFQANPSLTPGDVEDALEDTARPFAFGGSYEPDVTNDGITSFDKGHGLVDVVGAVARARMFHLFPAGATPCSTGGPVSVDPAGDARDLASAESTPVPNEPALDVRQGNVAWDAASQTLTMRIRVAELGDKPLTNGSDGESFNFFFTHVGTEYRVNASRTATGAQSYSLTGAPASAPKPTGSFDPAQDLVTINLPAAALKSEKVAAPTDGTALLNLYVWSRRVAGAAAPVADRTSGLCPFTLGLGAVPPPPGTTTGPDPAPKPVYAPPASEATLTRGGAPFTWSAGPFASASVPLVFGNECSDVLVANKACDRRGVTLDVPEGGATIEIVVTPSNPAGDFDLHLYAPDGRQVGTAGGTPVVDSPTSSEKISLKVTEGGVYRIDVVPYTTAGQSFKGEAKLV